MHTVCACYGTKRHTRPPAVPSRRCLPFARPHPQVLSLGRVEWLNRAFHTERFIWPIGYRARRKARTPAGGADEVWHTVEVLEDRGQPLFRWGWG